MKWSFLLLINFLSIYSFAQKAQISNDWIIEISPKADIQDISDHFGAVKFDKLCLNENIFLLDFELQKVSSDQILNHKDILRGHPDVRVQKRNIPNDPGFENQRWYLETIKAIDVWQTQTGGKTLEGVEIVIAVIDEGFDPDHDELIGNKWINKFEIPNDNIDNDNNGYVDDIEGINVITEGNIHNEDFHGTSVAGIIGAKGNNSQGITGINWDIKLMFISNIMMMSDIIKGYDYVADQRRRFNNSNGELGSFVVASNFSAGFGNLFGSDYTFFCDVYDRLGEVGIVSVGSAANVAEDAGTDGDLPSTCPSDYLMVVTNSLITDQLESSSGFSNEWVDLAAPGEGISSLDSNNGFRNITGTSASCPMVAGAIGLLYASNCDVLLERSITAPTETAKFIKKAIMDNVDQHPSLINTTVSGGRLNIYNALLELPEFCGLQAGISDKLSIDLILPNPPVNEISTVQFSTNEIGTHEYWLVNANGETLDYRMFTPQLFGEKTITIETQNLPQGVYFVHIENESDHVVDKILVTRN